MPGCEQPGAELCSSLKAYSDYAATCQYHSVEAAENISNNIQQQGEPGGGGDACMQFSCSPPAICNTCDRNTASEQYSEKPQSARVEEKYVLKCGTRPYDVDLPYSPSCRVASEQYCEKPQSAGVEQKYVLKCGTQPYDVDLPYTPNCKVQKIRKPVQPQTLGFPVGILCSTLVMREDKKNWKSILYAAYLKAVGLIFLKDIRDWEADDIDLLIREGEYLCLESENRSDYEESRPQVYSTKESKIMRNFEFMKYYFEIELEHNIWKENIKDNLHKDLAEIFAREALAFVLLQVTHSYMLIWKMENIYFVLDLNGRNALCLNRSNNEQNAVPMVICLKELINVEHLIINLSNIDATESFLLREMKVAKLVTPERCTLSRQIGERTPDYEIVNDEYAYLLSNLHLTLNPAEVERNRSAFLVAITVIIASKIDHPATWSTQTIDQLICYGYNLWMHRFDTNSAINLSSFPQFIRIGEYFSTYNLIPQKYVGSWTCRPLLCQYEFRKILTQALEVSNNILFQINRQMYAIWKKNGYYYLLDPYRHTIMDLLYDDECENRSRRSASVRMLSTIDALLRIFHQILLQSNMTATFYVHTLQLKSVGRWDKDNQSIIEPPMEADIVSLNEYICFEDDDMMVCQDELTEYSDYEVDISEYVASIKSVETSSSVPVEEEENLATAGDGVDVLSGDDDKVEVSAKSGTNNEDSRRSTKESIEMAKEKTATKHTKPKKAYLEYELPRNDSFNEEASRRRYKKSIEMAKEKTATKHTNPTKAYLEYELPRNDSFNEEASRRRYKKSIEMAKEKRAKIPKKPTKASFDHELPINDRHNGEASRRSTKKSMEMSNEMTAIRPKKPIKSYEYPKIDSPDGGTNTESNIEMSKEKIVKTPKEPTKASLEYEYPTIESSDDYASRRNTKKSIKIKKRPKKKPIKASLKYKYPIRYSHYSYASRSSMKGIEKSKRANLANVEVTAENKVNITDLVEEEEEDEEEEEEEEEDEQSPKSNDDMNYAELAQIKAQLVEHLFRSSKHELQKYEQSEEVIKRVSKKHNMVIAKEPVCFSKSATEIRQLSINRSAPKCQQRTVNKENLSCNCTYNYRPTTYRADIVAATPTNFQYTRSTAACSPVYFTKPRKMAVGVSESGSYSSILKLICAGFECTDRIMLLTPWSTFIVFQTEQQRFSRIKYLLFDGYTSNFNRFRYLDVNQGNTGLVPFPNLHDVIYYIIDTRDIRARLKKIQKPTL